MSSASKTVLAILGIAVAAVVVVLLVSSGGSQQSSNENSGLNVPLFENTNEPLSNGNTNSELLNLNVSGLLPNANQNTNRQNTNSSSPRGQVKTFNVDGSPFRFSVSEMRVKRGDTVKVVFTNKEGFHDWVIDEFSARAPQIAAGKTETVQFVANKAGTFEYYCSVGQHRAQGMKGNLIVE